MKKIFAIIFSSLIICSLAGCGQSKTSEASQTTTAQAATQAATEAEATKADTITGGYTDAASPVIPDEVKAAFEKATETLTGVGYVPVAYLGSQVVAGTNHLLLCKATPATEESTATYALVTLYEDANGGAQLTDIQNCAAEAPAETEEGVTGAYEEPETPEVTAEAKAALTKACEGLTGASYEAKALLGTQVVAGTNYQLLCKITPVTPDATASYAVVTVWEKTDGTAEITDTAEFTKEEAADADGNAEAADATAEPNAETSEAA